MAIRHLAARPPFQTRPEFMACSRRIDTLGRRLLETMACGVPAVTYAVAGALDVIRNGINGWMDEAVEPKLAEKTG